MKAFANLITLIVYLSFMLSSHTCSTAPITQENSNKLATTSCSETVFTQITRFKNLLKFQFEFMKDQISEYTNIQYRKNPEQVYIFWSLHRLNLNHPLLEYLPTFNLTNANINFNHLNETAVIDDLYNILPKMYETLVILQEITNIVNKERQERRANWYEYSADLLRADKCFNELEQQLQLQLLVVEEALSELNIDLSEVPNKIEFVRNANVDLHWFVAKECLQIMQYLSSLFEYLESKCMRVNA